MEDDITISRNEQTELGCVASLLQKYHLAGLYQQTYIFKIKILAGSGKH